MSENSSFSIARIVGTLQLTWQRSKILSWTSIGIVLFSDINLQKILETIKWLYSKYVKIKYQSLFSELSKAQTLNSQLQCYEAWFLLFEPFKFLLGEPYLL